jgi:hypothetical protein
VFFLANYFNRLLPCSPDILLTTFAHLLTNFTFRFMAFAPARLVDWQPLRDAYVKRSPRPTYAELSTEFGVPLGTIGACASEEAWTSLRAQYLEARLQEADAASILLEAIKIDRTLIRAVADLALVAFMGIKKEVERLEEKVRAPATNLEALNTAGFAAANFTRALKDCGIIGLPKGMAGEGKEDNGRWNPQMLQQINVNVGEIIAKARTELEAKTTAPAADPLEPKSDPKPTS